MRKLILAPMALACLIGTAAAQQAPTMNVGNFPAIQAVSQSGSWGFGLTGPIPTGSNVIGGVTQSGTWSVGLAAGSNAIGSVLSDLRVAGAAVTSGNPVPVTVGNFPATQTVAGSVTANLGTLNGAALDTSVQAVRTALGSPFQSGGSIGNTAFGISGALPSFASTQTFNLGSLNGAATAAAQATSNTSLASIDGKLGALGQKPSAGSAPVVIASDQPSLTTKIDQTTPGTTNRVFLAAAQPAVISTAALAANATSPLLAYYTGMGADGTFAYPFAYYTCSAFADQAGTLFVESSLNDSLYFPRNGTAGTAVAAGATVDVKVPLTMNVMRCRFVNGSAAQAKFMLTGNPTRY